MDTTMGSTTVRHPVLSLSVEATYDPTSVTLNATCSEKGSPSRVQLTLSSDEVAESERMGLLAQTRTTPEGSTLNSGVPCNDTYTESSNVSRMPSANTLTHWFSSGTKV